MEVWKKRRTAAMIILVLAAVSGLLWLFFSGKFTDVDSLQEYMRSFGVFAPIALTLFQAAQVVVPVLPGALGYAAGTLLFGVAGGFICNYIGITLGSIVAFFLARRYGIKIVLLMFSQETYDKWHNRVTNSRYYALILLAVIVLPFFPDDFFCYFSGLMKMDTKKFLWILILGKPWCILAYSLAFGLIG